MKILFYSLVLIASCSLKLKQPTQPKLETIKLMQTFPFISPDGKFVASDTNFIRVHRYENSVLYDIEYRYNFRDDDTAYSERRHNYLAFFEGENKGIYYSDQNGLKKTVVNVDSLLNEEWIRANNLYGYFMGTIIKRIKSKKLSNGRLSEFYEFYDTLDTKVKRASGDLLFSNKFPNEKLTLSGPLDSLKGMKLVKAKFIIHKRFYPKENITIDDFESNFSLQRESPRDFAFILEYLKKFKTDYDILLK